MKKPNIFMLLIASFLGTILSIGFIIFQYYFHELGHLILGYASNIVLGYFPLNPHITSWTTLLGIPIPVQIAFKSMLNTPLFSLGGPIFTIIWGLLITWFLYKLIPKPPKIIFYKVISSIVIVLYFIEAIVGNVLFGTDYPGNNTPLFLFAEHPIIEYLFGFIELILFFILAFGFSYVLYLRFIWEK